MITRLIASLALTAPLTAAALGMTAGAADAREARLLPAPQVIAAEPLAPHRNQKVVIEYSRKVWGGWYGKPYRPCRYEDSNNCYWDAKCFGNGQGRSFVVLGNGRVIYSRMIDHTAPRCN